MRRRRLRWYDYPVLGFLGSLIAACAVLLVIVLVQLFRVVL